MKYISTEFYGIAIEIDHQIDSNYYFSCINKISCIECSFFISKSKKCALNNKYSSKENYLKAYNKILETNPEKLI